MLNQPSFLPQIFCHNRIFFQLFLFILTLCNFTTPLFAFDDKTKEIYSAFPKSSRFNTNKYEDIGKRFLDFSGYYDKEEDSTTNEAPFSHRILEEDGHDDEFFPENENNDLDYSDQMPTNKSTIFVRDPNGIGEAIYNASIILNSNPYRINIAQVYLYPNITYNFTNSLNISISYGLLFLATINTTTSLDNGVYDLHDDSTMIPSQSRAIVNLINVNDTDRAFITLYNYASIDLRYIEFSGAYSDSTKIFQFLEYNHTIDSDDLIDIVDDELFIKDDWNPGKFNLINVDVSNITLLHRDSFFMRNFYALNMVRCKFFHNTLQTLDSSAFNPSSFIRSELIAWMVTISDTSFVQNKISSELSLPQTGVHTMLYLRADQTCETYIECTERDEGIQRNIFIMKNSSIEYNIINGTGSSMIWLATSFNPFFGTEKTYAFQIVYSSISNNEINQENLQCHLIFGVYCATAIIATPYHVIATKNPEYKIAFNKMENNILNGGANLLTFTNPSGIVHVHENTFDRNSLINKCFLVYIFQASEDIQLHDNIFQHHQLREESVLVLVENPGKELLIQNNHFLRNSISSSGGLVINTPTKTDIDSDEFHDNEIFNGVILLVNYPLRISIRNFDFQNNEVWATGTADNYITSSSFGDNGRTDSGLIIIIEPQSSTKTQDGVDIQNGIIQNNSMKKNSILVGIYKPNSTVNIDSVKFISNSHLGENSNTIYLHRPISSVKLQNSIFDNISFNRSSATSAYGAYIENSLLNIFRPIRKTSSLTLQANNFTNIVFDFPTTGTLSLEMSIFNFNFTSQNIADKSMGIDMKVEDSNFQNIVSKGTSPLSFSNHFNTSFNIEFESCLFQQIRTLAEKKTPLYFKNDKQGKLDIKFSSCSFTDNFSQGKAIIYVNGSDNAPTNFDLISGKFESNESPQGNHDIYLFNVNTKSINCSYFATYDYERNKCTNSSTNIPTYIVNNDQDPHFHTCTPMSCTRPLNPPSSSPGTFPTYYYYIIGLIVLVILLLVINPNVQAYINTIKTNFLKNLERRRRENMTVKQLEALIHMYGEQLSSKKKSAYREVEDEADISRAFVKALPIQLQLPYDCLKLGGIIGKGGSGVVLKAKMHKRMDVAIKIISSQLSGDMAEIQQELSMLYKTNHPSITRFYGASYKDGAILMIQEYCPINLEEYITDEIKEGHLSSMKPFLSIAVPLTDALVFLHGKRIAHRDIKPQNILLDVNRKPKLCDLGMAKVLHGKDTRELDDIFGDLEEDTRQNPERVNHPDEYKYASRRRSAAVTFQTKDAAGTPGYMPPELLSLENGMKYDPLRWDVFSLSMCFYFMFSGEHPLATYENFFLITDEIQKGTRPLLPSNMPIFLKDLIRLMWEQHPRNRPDMKRVSDSLDEMELELNLYSGDEISRKSATVQNPILDAKENYGHFEDSLPSQELVSLKVEK